MSDSNFPLLDYLKGNNLLLCHHNADPDAICSAYAFKKLVNRLKPNLDVDILLPGGASSLSKNLIIEFDISIKESVILDDYDVIFLLDTASFNQLGDWEEKIRETKKTVIVIDHHSIHPSLKEKAKLYLHDENATSTCEIITSLYQSLNETPEIEVAKALILGIIYDSKHLTIGTPNTLRLVADLLEQTDNLRTILKILTSQPSRSEKIARLKAGQRMNIHIIKDYILATAKIGAFQSSVARGFITLGADVAILAGSKKKKLRLSLRSTDRFYMETGIHLGRDIALPLSYDFDGAGSGHPTAAGFNGFGSADDIISKSIVLLKERLK